MGCTSKYICCAHVVCSVCACANAQLTHVCSVCEHGLVWHVCIKFSVYIISAWNNQSTSDPISAPDFIIFNNNKEHSSSTTANCMLYMLNVYTVNTYLLHIVQIELDTLMAQPFYSTFGVDGDMIVILGYFKSFLQPERPFWGNCVWPHISYTKLC